MSHTLICNQNTVQFYRMVPKQHKIQANINDWLIISLLFFQKNQTENLAQYTMYTGSGNPYNLSKISLFNGKKSLGIWSEETEGATCNKVQGSDGATFNPYVRAHHMFSRILNFLFVIVFLIAMSLPLPLLRI